MVLLNVTVYVCAYDIKNSVFNGFATAEVAQCNQTANLTGQLSALALNQATNACHTDSNIADLKYTVATEACADRQSVSNALRDVIASNTANTQAILDKMCQLELDSYKEKVSDLQTQLNIAALRESQIDQTARVLADNAAQTATLRQSLNPTPIPAYVVQNPNCCGQTFYGGCGCNA